MKQRVFVHFNRLSENGKPFEAQITIPRLIIRAKYSSSGVLIIIPASGAGDFDGTLGTSLNNRLINIIIN